MPELAEVKGSLKAGWCIFISEPFTSLLAWAVPSSATVRPPLSRVMRSGMSCVALSNAPRKCVQHKAAEAARKSC